MDLGHRPVLAGRDRAKVKAMATQMGLPFRSFPLTQREKIQEGVTGARTVLNAAGPFAQSARPIVEACIAAGAHYLDISGEALAIAEVVRFGKPARERGIMLMPAVGFDVVPSDCLVARVAKRLPDATTLEIGVSLPGRITAGSARSFLEYAGCDTYVRRHGKLVPVTLGLLERDFDFGDGARLCSAVSWGDTTTAYYTSGIPNITSYLETTATMRAAFRYAAPYRLISKRPLARALWNAATDILMQGPTGDIAHHLRSAIVVEAFNPSGGRARSRLTAGEPYRLTAQIASSIVSRVHAGDFEPGFQTPARLFGAELVSTFEGVVIYDE